jgi:hypothetical protein
LLIRSHKGDDAHLKGDGRRARDRKERTDREVERAGEKVGKALADLSAHGKEILALRESHCGDGEERQTHACDAEPDEGGEHLARRRLSHRGREDQIACAEEQPEQHRGDKHILFFAQTVFHSSSILL